MADFKLLLTKKPHPARMSVSGPTLPGMAMPELSNEEIKIMVEEAVKNATEGLVAAITTAVSHSVATTINCSVQIAVAKAIDEYEHECVLDLEADELKGLRKLADIASSLVDHGDIKDGISEIRDNHHFIKKFRRKVDKVGGAMLIAIAGTVVGTVLLILGIGVKEYFKNNVQ